MEKKKPAESGKGPDSLLHFKDRLEWRRWLAKNHLQAREAWVAFYKKATGKPSVTPDESVEEALCFGWIDGIKKSVDDERHAFRFTPRSSKSNWSAFNIRRVKRLIAEGKMTKAGMEAFNDAKQRVTPPLPTRLPANLQELFQQNKAASTNFAQFPPGYQRICIGWIASAKQPETQLRRLNTLISHSAQNKKIKFM